MWLKWCWCATPPGEDKIPPAERRASSAAVDDSALELRPTRELLLCRGDARGLAQMLLPPPLCEVSRSSTPALCHSCVEVSGQS